MFTGTLKHNPNARKRLVCGRKSDLSCFVVNIAYKFIVHNFWYLDSDYYRNMICNHSILTTYKSHTDGPIIFGNGAKSKIEGIGTIVNL